MVRCRIVERENAKFVMLQFGAGWHYAPQLHVWLSRNHPEYSRILQEEYQRIEFPIAGDIVQTPTGSLVLIPAEDKIVNYVKVPCGYRGDTEIEEVKNVEKFWILEDYESPRGNLGISKCVLYVAPRDAHVYIRFSRTGRLYGKLADGWMHIHPSGEQEELPMDIFELEGLV